MTFMSATESYPHQMDFDAQWMSRDTWAARHGSSNLNLYDEIQWLRKHDLYDENGIEGIKE